MTVIVDYGVGNLSSLMCSFRAIGAEICVSGDEDVIKSADKIVLPGVGAFGDAAKKLKDSGLASVLREQAESGKALLGICLGMQLLFDKSYEYGEHEGLGLIHGAVRPLSDIVPAEYKIPHMGWNGLEIKKDCPIFKYVKNGDFVYFVHSYYGAECEANTVATTEYGTSVTAAVANGNIIGCQFHPEKSGTVGLSILKAFSEMR